MASESAPMFDIQSQNLPIAFNTCNTPLNSRFDLAETQGGTPFMVRFIDPIVPTFVPTLFDPLGFIPTQKFFMPVIKNINDQAWEDAINRLHQLADLPRDWDSYEGEPPSSLAITTADELLQKLSLRIGKRASIPFSIMPLSGAGVQLEWRGSSKTIELEIGSSGEFGYLLIKGAGNAREFEEKDCASETEILSLIPSVVI